MTERKRCAWCGTDELYVAYHDEEWGVPLHDDRRLFEFLLLEGAQAGLSWITVLRKRENYREAYDGFDPERIARWDRRKVERLLKNPGIIRNRLKVESAVTGARAFLEIVEETGSFDRYLWDLAGGKVVKNRWKSLKEIPAKTETAERMSRALRKRGFKFVGPTICYAFMQATGMVNDHVTDCFRYREVSRPS